MKTAPLSFLMAVLLPVAAAAGKPKPPPVQQAEPAKPKAPAAQPDKPVAKPDSALPKVAPPPQPVRPGVTASGINGLVIEAVKRMPTGGGYASTGAATNKLVEAATVKKDAKGGLGFQPSMAQPSYCSGATYLVFLEVVSDLAKSGKLKLSDEALATLAVKRQADGVGVWGRWNANGPGTGKFFHDLGLGTNSYGLSQAKTGDFLKLWWNDHIGKKESGHSVIYLGRANTPEGDPGIEFWSSNEPAGMGVKVVPLTKVKRALVSRLEHPENLKNLPALEAKDDFLAGMLDKECSEETLLKTLSLTGTTGDAAPQGAGTEKIEVRINGVVEAAPEPVTPTAATDPATKFMGDSPYAAYTDWSKLAIIQLVQMRLRYDGVYKGAADGKPGASTIAALKEWQKASGLETSGVLDKATLLKMGLNGLGETKIQPAAASKAEAVPTRNDPDRR
jgi:hypothetical protein